MNKPIAPKFLEHHVPTPEYALVPDCLCERCSAVRRAWGIQRAEESRAEDGLPQNHGHCCRCELCYLYWSRQPPATSAPALADEVRSPCSVCGRPWQPYGCCTLKRPAEDVAPEALWERAEGPVMVERDIACPTCRRAFCRVLAPEGMPITVVCPGCVLEGR